MSVVRPEQFDAPLPQSPDAERAVLGSILINNRAFNRVRPILRAENFFRDAHKTIWAAMEREIGAGRDVDPLSLREALGGALASVGGVVYISSLLDMVPDVANVERYAEIVRERAEARGILAACHEASRQVLDGASPADVASSLRYVLNGVGMAEDVRSRGIGDVARDVRARADERKAAGKTAGVLTGFAQLDRLTGGYRRKQVSLIAARTSHGKTALLLNTARGAVDASAEAKVAVYSLEMGDEPVVNILRSQLSQVPLGRIADWNNIPEHDLNSVIAVDEFLARRWNDRFFFNDRLYDVDEVCADARRLKEDRGLDAVFVDYLQLVAGYRDEKVRERQVNRIAKQLFDLAKKIDVAVIELSQVTRPGHDRLSLDDLRESKAIGHDAHLVLMLNRPYQAHKDASADLECRTILQIEKNRGGQTCDLAYHFDAAVQTFTEGGCPSGCRYARRAR